MTILSSIKGDIERREMERTDTSRSPPASAQTPSPARLCGCTTSPARSVRHVPGDAPKPFGPLRASGARLPTCPGRPRRRPAPLHPFPPRPAPAPSPMLPGSPPPRAGRRGPNAATQLAGPGRAASHPSVAGRRAGPGPGDRGGAAVRRGLRC